MTHPAGPVSAVIPAYNSAHLLPRTIESALAQTTPLLEIIVVDDGSKDDPASVVQRYPAPVRLIQQKNGGVATARNAGIRAAQGDWIALLDADDFWLPEKTERQLDCALQHPQAAVVYSDADMVLPDGTSTGLYLADKDPRSGNVFDRLLEAFFILPSTAIVKREALDRCGLFSESLRKMEDYDLWLRLARVYEFQLLPETLTLYERQPTSSTMDVVGTSRSQVVLFRSLLAGDLTPAQAAKLRRRLGGTLFDLAYGVQKTAPRESLPLIWESIRITPQRLASWKLLAKSLALSARPGSR